MRVAVVLLLSCFAFAVLGDRVFEITNQCDFDVYVGAVADAGTNPGIFPKFWNDDGHLAPGGFGKMIIPAETWSSARIWGRTDCDWSRVGTFKCKTGDCNGQRLCHSSQYPGGSGGLSPVTLAEFTLCSPDSSFPQSRAISDTYDVSNVDGFNLPVTIHPVGQFEGSPYIDPEYPFLNCGLSGECFAGMTEWRNHMLEKGCPVNNRVYGNCLGNNECDEGATCIGSTGLCVATNSSSTVKALGCASDAFLSSLPEGARADNHGVDPKWPLHENHKEYACPNPPYVTVNCPANYHLPNVGKAPFKNWPEWFSGACARGSYGFAYDDAQNTYGCRTHGQGLSNTYAITFCPNADILKHVTKKASYDKEDGKVYEKEGKVNEKESVGGAAFIAQRRQAVSESRSETA